MTIPEEFLCPITTVLMTDPVLGSDGHSYERSAITEWLTHHETSPITRAPMRVADLTPNYTLKAMIDRSLKPIPRQYWRTNTSNPKSAVVSIASSASSVITEPYYALAATHPQQQQQQFLASVIIPLRPTSNNSTTPKKLVFVTCFILSLVIFIILAIRLF